MRAIKHVLTERWYAWDNARNVAMDDPEVNLEPEDGEESYTPSPIAEVGEQRKLSGSIYMLTKYTE